MKQPCFLPFFQEELKMPKAKYTKRKDGRYQANILIGHDDETGKKIFHPTIYAYTINELEIKIAEVRNALDKGIYANDKGYTLKEYADKWYTINKPSYEINTAKMYQRLVHTHIIPSLGEIQLKKLTKSDVQGMINKNIKHPRNCQQIRMCLIQILNSAIEDGLLYKNVAKNVKLPRYSRPEKRPLNALEEKALLAAVLTPKEKAFIDILHYTGLRLGETLALSTKDIDFSFGKIIVKNVIVFDGNTPVLKFIPKTDAGRRKVDMPTVLQDSLKSYVATLNSEYLFQMERKDGFMSKSSYRKFWNNICKKLNQAVGGTEDIQPIHDLTAYVFRHNYATMLFYADVDIKEAQYLLGHKDIKITLDVYTHLRKEKTSAGKKLDAFLA